MRFRKQVYESDGADGYSPGCWGYIVRAANGDAWCDGGFASREHAADAAKRRIARIEEVRS